MKNCVIFLFVCGMYSVQAQKVIPMVDFSGYFRSFQDGFFRQVEFQQIKEFKTGDDLVAYIDFRGNLRVFNGEKPMDLSNMNVEYEVSDHLLIWKIGPTINVWEDGKKQTLTFNARNYWVRDSIVVFEDMRYGSVNAYFKGQIYNLYTTIGDFDPPDKIGENVVAFRDNGNYNKIFWNGEIIDIDVTHHAVEFSAGTDVVAFNDPLMGTFVVFDKGTFHDVESFTMPSFKAGRGFVLYETQNGDLMYFGNGQKKRMTNFSARFYDVKDDVAIWEENGYTYALQNGEKVEMARFQLEDYKLKNGIIAFRNLMGGVSALVNGKVVEITTQMNAEYEIHGNAVLVKLFNNSYVVFKDGRKYNL